MNKKTNSWFKYVVIIAVLLVPFMYSFFYLKAYWNPYGKGNIDNLPVAVVNKDSGDKGKELIDNIKFESAYKVYGKVFEVFKKALEEKEFTATAGGGAVEVTISGKREVTKVKLDEEVVDPDDIEMLEDLIIAATNEALRKVEEESAAVMSKLTGGLSGLGGGLPF